MALLTFFPSVRSALISALLKIVLDDLTFVIVAVLPDTRISTFAPFHALGRVTALFFTLMIVASVMGPMIQQLRRGNKAAVVIVEDGSYDIEFVIEFFPQRFFYLGLLISGTTLLFCISYLVYDGVRRLRRKRSVGQ